MLISNNKSFGTAAAALVLWLTGHVFANIASAAEVTLTGRTMGTAYRIIVNVETAQNTDGLATAISTQLNRINAQMSTYRPDSEITRFNKLADLGKSITVSPEFWAVLMAGNELHALTQGAWDGTVFPLITLWGFNAPGGPEGIPDTEKIVATKRHVGWHLINTDASQQLGKRASAVQLDLASVAKGFAVDQVAALLRERQIRNFLAEIGGEVYAAGVRKDGLPWRVGINRPVPGAAPDDVYMALWLPDRALATSGDYRIFTALDGRRYSHILDPRTGFPVNNGIVSVSIVAPDCTMADGLATGVMIMGVEAGLELINRLPEVEGLIVVRGSGDDLANHVSDGFKAFLSR
jgi:thiamine biosynthesis lipoprotein